MTKEQIKANDLTQMKGSSNWLTTLPLESLNKREFVDALSLRYRWQLKRMPSICPCGKTYHVDRAMNCHTGGFVYQRHDKTRNTIAKMMNDVLVDVEIDPALIPLTGEQLQDNTNLSDEARVDISVTGEQLQDNTNLSDEARVDISVTGEQLQDNTNLSDEARG